MSSNPKFLEALDRGDSYGDTLRQLTAGNPNAMLAARLAFELGTRRALDEISEISPWSALRQVSKP